MHKYHPESNLKSSILKKNSVEIKKKKQHVLAKKDKDGGE